MLFVERYLHCLKTGQRASYIRKQTKLNFYKYCIFGYVSITPDSFP
jgi:hypothetical protein